MKRPVLRIIIGLCVFATAPLHAQNFAGGVQGTFTNPLDGEIGNAGTNSITIPSFGDQLGTLTFTGNANYSVGEQPFLLGRVDFQSVLSPLTGLTFQVTLDTQNADGTTGTVNFCPTLTFDQGGEPGLRIVRLQFDPNEARTSAVDGTAYTLSFAGVTESDTWTGEASDSLFSEAFGDPATGYIWATLNQAAPGTPIDPNCGDDGCGCEPPPGVPEPTSCVLAGLGLLGAAMGRRWRRGQMPVA